MSLATWKKEFYRTPASRISKKGALAHSLRKWLGLYKSVLKKHGLECQDYEIVDERDRALEISANSCALCGYFYNDDSGCPKCPLTIALDHHCNWPDPDTEFSIWHDWHRNSNPRPMIAALRKAIKFAEREKGTTCQPE